MDDLVSARLIRCYQRGDLEAFVLLHDRYRRLVWRIALARVGSEHDADDVTQQVFVQVLVAVGAYRPEGRSFRRWLSRVAQNAAEDHWRRSRRSDGTEPDRLDRWVEAAQEEPPVWGDAMTVHDLVGGLSEAEQQVLVLLYRWDLSAREAGVALGRSEGSVRTVHSRALARIRTALAESP